VRDGARVKVPPSGKKRARNYGIACFVGIESICCLDEVRGGWTSSTGTSVPGRKDSRSDTWQRKGTLEKVGRIFGKRKDGPRRINPENILQLSKMAYWSFKKKGDALDHTLLVQRGSERGGKRAIVCRRGKTAYYLHLQGVKYTAETSRYLEEEAVAVTVFESPPVPD